MRLDRLLENNRPFLIKSLLFMCGIYIGFSSSNWIRSHFLVSRVERCSLNAAADNLQLLGRVKARTLSHEFHTKQFLLAGIMTAEKFLDSRASVVYNTWGKTVSGKVLFFAGNETGKAHDLPLVSLRGVDDSYPPQRKSLMMLKYMHDNYIDQFEWFMRSDDDVYVRTEKLEAFLRTFDSSNNLFIGQAGVGARDERGRLGLGPKDNFCMGGPGMIMSRTVLKKLAPHLEYCLENLLSYHEDVEVGRCVRRFVGVSCTWAIEMQWLFYHNQSKSNAFHWDLDTKAVQNAITLHPVKDSKYMYRLHTYFLKEKIRILQHQLTVKASRLRSLGRLTKKNLPAKELTKLKEVKDLYLNIPRSAALHWEVFSPRKVFTTTLSPPILPIQNSVRRSLNLILGKSLMLINEDSRKILFRELALSRVNLGYLRVSPTQGVQYLLDLLMMTYQHLGFSHRKLPLHVRYRAHMQQPFGSLVYTSSEVPMTKPYVHFILPLAGRLKPFAAFLSNFEKVVLLNNEKVKLLIVYFPDVAPLSNHQKILKIYQDHYPNFEIIWKTIKGPFSRALALQFGVSNFGPEALLFFCDVDIIFDMEFVERCRRNTVRGKRVYYPIVFSQFNQSMGNFSYSPSSLQRERGFWRNYGFGIVCAYGGDVSSAGGFDTTIQGWGLEDVKLYEQFLSVGKYDIIRAPDPGLTHVHHGSVCSSDLDLSRLKMCENSRVSQLASSRALVDYMERKGYFYV